MRAVRVIALFTLLVAVGCRSATTLPEDEVGPDNTVLPAAKPESRPHFPASPSGALPEPPRMKADDPRKSQPAPVHPSKTRPRQGAGGGVRAQSLRALSFTPGTDMKVKLKLLVVTARRDETGFPAITTFLEQIGVPYDVLIASRGRVLANPAPDQTGDDVVLESSPGLGNYNGVILTTSNLAFFDTELNGWYSALDPSERATLNDYEAAYKVREISLYTWPDGDDNTCRDTGLRLAGTPTDAPRTAGLTSDGSAVFSDLQGTASLVVRYAYGYPAQVCDTSTTKALSSYANGDVLVAVRRGSDLRETMHITADHNPHLEHSRLLSYGLVRWVSRGVFLGQKKYYFTAHVDDYFISDDLWANGSPTGSSFRLSPEDVEKTIAWQNAFAANGLSGFKLDMAFNGEGYQQNVVAVCDPTARGSYDALSAYTRCIAKSFRWVNHTYSHIYIDPNTTATKISNEIKKNRTVATGTGGLGLTSAEYSPNLLVTGNHSGLGYLDEGFEPFGYNVPVNRGKSKANPNLVSAAANLSIQYMASNSSAPTNPPTEPIPGSGAYCESTPADCSQNNPSPNVGQKFPGNLPANNILLVPRYPVNVFYNVSTPQEETEEYNAIFRSYWNRDLSYEEILAFESEMVMSHISAGNLNPHFFHQPNMRAFEGNRSLISDLLDQVAQKYNATYRVPLQNPTFLKVGTLMRARAAFNTALPAAIWNKRTGIVSVTANNRSTDIQITNPKQGTQYGSDKVATAVSGTTIDAGKGLQ